MTDGISGLNFGTLTGRVIDDSDTPLENITITYGDGTISVTTVSNGEFMINLPVGSNTITISIEGYNDDNVFIFLVSLSLDSGILDMHSLHFLVSCSVKAVQNPFVPCTPGILDDEPEYDA